MPVEGIIPVEGNHEKLKEQTENITIKLTLNTLLIITLNKHS